MLSLGACSQLVLNSAPGFSWTLSSPQAGIGVLLAVPCLDAIVPQYSGAGMAPDFCTWGTTLLECLMCEIQYCRWEGISGSHLNQSLAEGSTNVKAASGSTWLCAVEFWVNLRVWRLHSLFGHLFCPGYLVKVHWFQLQTLPMTVDVAGILRQCSYNFSCTTDCTDSAVGVEVW